ncbi:hypothetical protein HDU96_005701 [Phlyctochytrium bullatum]|nr:hypothetical protein HDU96_005701 [Phlyctochytrium bullatum]
MSRFRSPAAGDTGASPHFHHLQQRQSTSQLLAHPSHSQRTPAHPSATFPLPTNPHPMHPQAMALGHNDNPQELMALIRQRQSELSRAIHALGSGNNPATAAAATHQQQPVAAAQAFQAQAFGHRRATDVTGDWGLPSSPSLLGAGTPVMASPRSFDAGSLHNHALAGARGQASRGESPASSRQSSPWLGVGFDVPVPNSDKTQTRQQQLASQFPKQPQHHRAHDSVSPMAAATTLLLDSLLASVATVEDPAGAAALPDPLAPGSLLRGANPVATTPTANPAASPAEQRFVSTLSRGVVAFPFHPAFLKSEASDAGVHASKAAAAVASVAGGGRAGSVSAAAPQQSFMRGTFQDPSALNLDLLNGIGIGGFGAPEISRVAGSATAGAFEAFLGLRHASLHATQPSAISATTQSTSSSASGGATTPPTPANTSTSAAASAAPSTTGSPSVPATVAPSSLEGLTFLHPSVFNMHPAVTQAGNNTLLASLVASLPPSSLQDTSPAPPANTNGGSGSSPSSSLSTPPPSPKTLRDVADATAATAAELSGPSTAVHLTPPTIPVCVDDALAPGSSGSTALSINDVMAVAAAAAAAYANVSGVAAPGKRAASASHHDDAGFKRARVDAAQGYTGGTHHLHRPMPPTPPPASGAAATDATSSSAKPKAKRGSISGGAGSRSVSPATTSAKPPPRAPGDYVCTLPGCSKTFATPERLRSHLWIHRRTRSLACEWEGCRKKFFTRQDLTRHLNGHKQLRGHTCEYCGGKFTRQDALQRHLRLRRCPRQPAGEEGEGMGVGARKSGEEEEEEGEMEEEAGEVEESGDDDLVASAAASRG